LCGSGYGVELLLGVVSRVGPGIGVLGEGGCAPSVRGSYGVSSRDLDSKTVSSGLRLKALEYWKNRESALE